jgi:hypothetical protein
MRKDSGKPRSSPMQEHHHVNDRWPPRSAIFGAVFGAPIGSSTFSLFGFRLQMLQLPAQQRGVFGD